MVIENGTIHETYSSQSLQIDSFALNNCKLSWNSLIYLLTQHLVLREKSIKTTCVHTEYINRYTAQQASANSRSICLCLCLQWQWMAESVSECALQMLAWKCMKYIDKMYRTWIYKCYEWRTSVSTQPLITSGKFLFFF